MVSYSAGGGLLVNSLKGYQKFSCKIQVMNGEAYAGRATHVI